MEDGMRKVLILGAAAVLAAGAAFAHSSGHGGPSNAGEPGDPKKVTRTVKLDASEYAFSEQALSFKPGETVKFVVSNKGKLKHELTIGDAVEQAAHAAEMSKMSDMKHDEDSHEMPANSIHVGPGETRELVWKFSKAGKLLFACNYPGHSDLGMQGRIVVE
jgi:uncharacterized cupredoxin-like copper-binding protein